MSYLAICLFLFSQGLLTQEFSSEFQEAYLPSPNKADYEEQIKCQDLFCKKIPYSKDGKYLSEVWEELGKNGGKVVIDFLDHPLSLSDSQMDDVTEYLREIAKRDGHVSLEPFYIATRGIGFTDVPIIKDLFGLSYNLYKRIRSAIKFSRMGHYNAKVLYHPSSGKVLQILFFHKNYGNLCDTVYSTCDRIEYIDDELFDKQLSLKLSETQTKRIEIRFTQTPAVLPQMKLDIGNLLDTNRSARLYKWLIITKKTETKTVTRERFLGVELAIKVLDYTLSAYEIVEAIQLYMPARTKQAEVVYEDKEEGRILKSVVFYPIVNQE
ncbi:hypothetical protein ND861_14860 [Leptospira sp. 2 VSF19]|uniref:Uncharacterized protein n=1 Tax=Leptospira soteropolitanensis TaxID=2950025 RepID=A0AAW5VF65_9LEPT|nr:hypothetical protein [Leptospira soteropolitanensis]MCW7493872.1 hypothetical protein [Leptospira soteropolitanensis]MCW7501466.1 hypothetical protein [Leptospira soteropolitanensis]MCW7523771.1 hypothetical protein [Leptospira soteropolitanensis]MCW7527635.1 hypothetical protein [Leptospira soteropolitanensis]MCW7531489.1 hypothetical protein [Leptospira soteropolitanensis]